MPHDPFPPMHPGAPLPLDWTPLLGLTGVLLARYLADMETHQRALRPLLLPPQPPSPAQLQARFGLAEPWQIQGPLYLLTATGLLPRPPWVPPHDPTTRPLDPPALDWGVLDRVLTALLPALDPTHPEHPSALAAVSVLQYGGVLQATDPASLFYEDGVWPALLPRLVSDARWVRLFTALHGAAALLRYRRQALLWLAGAERVRARRDQAQTELAAYLQAAQERHQDDGGADPAGGSGMDGGSGAWSSGVWAPADHATPPPDEPAADEPPIAEEPVPPDTPAGTQTAPVAADPGATPWQESLPDRVDVAGDHEPGATHHTVSLADRSDVAGDRDHGATSAFRQPPEPLLPLSLAIMSLSLADRSLRENLKPTQESTNDTIPTATHDSCSDNASEPASDGDLHVERHLDAAELTSTRQDAAFWCAVNQILTGSAARYPHTPGEKKAAERQFKRQQIPIGVILAALRAVMSLADRPRAFGDAIASDRFQVCLTHALTLLPAYLPQPTEGRAWFAFLHAYRRIGRAHGLRDVRAADYHALQALFTAEPDACWGVVERWQETPPARIAPTALRRALHHGALRRRGMQPPLPWGSDVPARAADDPRRALLSDAGLSPRILTPAMTADYLQAWIAEADARAGELKNRAAWLTWGIGSGHWPQDHPQVPPRRAAARPAPPAAPPPAPVISAEQRAWQEVWSGVQRRLSAHVPAQDYATWLQETALVELTSGEAIVATPNIFARERVAAEYAPLIAHALQQQTRQAVRVQVVLEPSRAVYGGYA